MGYYLTCQNNKKLARVDGRLQIPLHYPYFTPLILIDGTVQSQTLVLAHLSRLQWAGYENTFAGYDFYGALLSGVVFFNAGCIGTA